jgi:pimeloyl-ACP methyl ester carboxylesterase
VIPSLPGFGFSRPLRDTGWSYGRIAGALVELPEDAVDRDHLLTNVSVYRLTGTAGSSAGHYYDVAHDPMMWAPRERGTVPTGVAVSRTQEVAIRRLAERDHNVVHWSEFDRGGHFAATEAPEFLVGDVRALLRKLGER